MKKKVLNLCLVSLLAVCLACLVCVLFGFYIPNELDQINMGNALGWSTEQSESDVFSFSLFSLASLCGIALCGIKIYDLVKDIRGTVDKSAKDEAKRQKLQAKLDKLNEEKEP